MSQILHLHIGMPKTASTTLQALLLQNRAQLEARGYAYPVPVPGKIMGNAVPLAQFFRKGIDSARFEFHNPGVLDFTDAAAFFERTYMAHTCDHLVLSGEALYKSVQEYDYHFLFDHFETIKVYLALRPKMLWLESHFFQRIKTGNYRDDIADLLADGTLEEPIESTLNYARTYDYWCNLVGAENVNLHFLGAGFGRIEDQFLKALLGEIPQAFEYPAPKNEALGITALAAITQIPLDLRDVAAHWKANRRICSRAKKLELTAKKSVLLPDLRAWLTERFADDNRAFAARQDVISLEDLQPDISAHCQDATTLATTRESDDYARLRRDLQQRFDLKI